MIFSELFSLKIEIFSWPNNVFSLYYNYQGKNELVRYLCTTDESFFTFCDSLMELLFAVQAEF